MRIGRLARDAELRRDLARDPTLRRKLEDLAFSTR
jgi:hypothetical protein